jgi:hypothetical protein
VSVVTNLGSQNFPKHFLEQQGRAAGPAMLLGPVCLQSAGQLTLNLKANSKRQIFDHLGKSMRLK